MSIISVNNLTFAYDGNADNIFENVNFRIDTDWRLGFTGRNGRGKTTFLKLLLGQYEFSGSIKASTGLEYFPYDVTDCEQWTIDIVHEICPNSEDWQIMREIKLLEVDDSVLYRSFSTLSHGERTKVLLASLFLRENSFLLIDEPTNHLDSEARRVLGEYLKRKKGFILVSHDRALLDTCTDHTLSINKTNIEIESGSFSSWLRNKELRDGFEQRENERLKKDIKRLSDAARRSASWSVETEKGKFNTTNSGVSVDRGFVGHKAAKMMKRSKAIDERRQKAVEEKSQLLKNIEQSETLKISPLIHPCERLAELKNISISYGERTICHGISFDINRGDIISLCGKNGCGKSSILKLICGEAITYNGSLQRASGLKISYVSQDTSHLSGSLSDYAAEHKIDEALFKTILRKFGFERTQFAKNMEDFSGGQKRKVLLARSLCEQAHLYVWDEPLNYIDVISRIQLENLLNQFRPTMLLVEHDATFCRNISARSIKIDG